LRPEAETKKTKPQVRVPKRLPGRGGKEIKEKGKCEGVAKRKKRKKISKKGNWRSQRKPRGGKRARDCEWK